MKYAEYREQGFRLLKVTHTDPVWEGTLRGFFT